MCRLRGERNGAHCLAPAARLFAAGLALAAGGCAAGPAQPPRPQLLTLAALMGSPLALRTAPSDFSGPLSPAEQEAVIARAITAHEMRRP